MVLFVYPTATKLKYIVQTITKTLDEIPFIATPEGLEVKRLTPDKTTMVILRLPITSFEEYDLGGEEEVTFIVSSDELNRVLKRGTRNDIVEIELEEDKRRIKIAFKDKKTNVTRTFYIETREGIVEKLSEPQVELTVSAKMLTDDLKNIINDAKMVGDEIDLIAYEDRLEAQTITPQKTYLNRLYADQGLLSYNISATPPIRSKYSVDLLKPVTKATTAADTVTLEYGEALPLRLSFDLPGGGILVYWISART